MIRETAHNATAVDGEKHVLKPLQVRDIAGIAWRDQRSEAINPQ
jgi:hypothetical protein